VFVLQNTSSISVFRIVLCSVSTIVNFLEGEVRGRQGVAGRILRTPALTHIKYWNGVL
jgi:hypothetical protein